MSKKRIVERDKPLNLAVIGIEAQYQGQFDKACLQSIVDGTKKLLHDVDSTTSK